MDDIMRPLVALGFVILALLALLLVKPSFESSPSRLADNQSTVSELGLRFNLQR